MSLEIGDSIGSAIPYAVSRPDQVPSKRYFDPAFYQLEQQKLWSRVWQMACRLQEIPKPGDYVVYTIFDQSIIVTRVDENTVKAYQNHCRHRGVELVQDRGRRPGGFVCPFHGWRWNLNGESTFVYQPDVFSEENLCQSELDLVEVRLDTWGGCAFINFDDDAPSLHDSLKPFSTMHDAWKVEDLQVEWWCSARLPVNWKLAMEAFMEGYHVASTHPQLLPPGTTSNPGEVMYVQIPEEHVTVTRWVTVAAEQMPTEVESRQFIEMNLNYMRILSQGMAGLTHEREVNIAEQLAELVLPRDVQEATIVWRKAVNAAVMAFYRDQGLETGDLNDLDDRHWSTMVNYCFPNYFILPSFGSAASYRIRPLGPEECLFELWSLTRFPEGEAPQEPLKTPEPMEWDDPRWPPIPKQDFTNLPKQQRGLHGSGFKFMRLSSEVEGLISNYQRLIDGYLAGIDSAKLAEAASKVSGTIDVPVVDLGL